MQFCKLLLSSLLFAKICLGKEAIQHNLPEGVELVDPQSLGLNSNIDLDKLLGNVKLLPISGNGLKQNGLKTQILTVGFDGDENINLDDFELPPLGDTASEKPIAEAAFKSFKDFFKNPNKSMSFEEGTKVQLNKDIQEYGTKTGKILSGQRTTSESFQSSQTTSNDKHNTVSSHGSQQRPSGTLRRRIKKPKTTTTEQPKLSGSKTTVAIEPPTANSFNQFDLPNYGLPAGQSPKVIELGHDQIEKLLASGKLTKSQGSGPQVIELGEEQLEDLLREHSKDTSKSSSQNQNKVQYSSNNVFTTPKPTQVLTTSRPKEVVTTTTGRVQEVVKNYSPPATNVIQTNYHENKGVQQNGQIHTVGQNGQSNSNSPVITNGLRNRNLVGNQLTPVYHFGNQNSPPRVVLNNNPQIQHGFQPILQPSNLITPISNINFIQDPRLQQHHFPQQPQQQNQQQQQQQQQQSQQQQQQQSHQQHQQQQSQQQQHHQIHLQQQLQQQLQSNRQQQNIQTNKPQSSFEVISAPPVSFSSSSEPIKGNGGQNSNNHVQVQQQRQVANSNIQQQVFVNNNQQFQNPQQNNVRPQPQVHNSYNSNINTLQNRPTPTHGNNNKENTNSNGNNRPNNPPQQQKLNHGNNNNNNIGLNIVRPPLQSQRLITPSPFIIHQVLNQIPSSFNPTLTAKHVVNSPVLDPSVTFRQDPLPQHQQQHVFSPTNGNRHQQTGQIHFPGNHNQRIRQRDQVVANSNHADALRFGQNFNLQYQGPARQSQIIGQFSSPFYHPHRDLSGI